MHAEFAQAEALISSLRNRQAVIVNELDKANVPAGAGHRSMPEYLTARFDLAPATAAVLAKGVSENPHPTMRSRRRLQDSGGGV